MLPVWATNDDCCLLLASFVSAAVTLADCHGGHALLARSGGTIGELTHLLVAVTVTAVESGEEAFNHHTVRSMT